uniref:Chromosome 3 open reading frame 38 n=1 Tax=Poecilia formosa TaxID=48698 RepID=A0A096MA89_POEFO
VIMSGLSETERVGFKKILSSMTDVDLRSLSDTVTNKMIVVENVTEAMETILSFSKSAEELLRRRKVHRDLIFKYLVKEGVTMPPTSEKHQLVKRTLELWSSVTVGQAKHTSEQLNSCKTKHNYNEQPKKHTKHDKITHETLILGQQFCQWFFQILNSQNPSLGQQPQDWGPQHFWPDVKLRLLSRATTEQMEEFQGAEVVSLRLLALTSGERLVFSPNLDPHGLRAVASPHGLVLVGVAGTIHRDQFCLGIFEQIFGLIRSPLNENSWKIKFINLKIRGQDGIEGTEVAAPALNYNSSELQLLCS